ncbi:MAG TPA: hypothetical protein VGO93_23455 [Candidatus Xenobia bacterium]|jgi:hypothetical protein
MKRWYWIPVLLLVTGCGRVQWLPTSTPIKPSVIAPPPAIPAYKPPPDLLAGVALPSPTPDAVNNDELDTIIKGGAYLNEDLAHRLLADEAEALLVHHEWDELQDLCTDYELYRSDYAFDRWGLYGFLHNAFWKDSASLDDLSLVDAWRSARPDSPLPYDALALAHVSCMWNQMRPGAEPIEPPQQVMAHSPEADRLLFESDHRIRGSAIYGYKWLWALIMETSMEVAASYAQPHVDVIRSHLKDAIQRTQMPAPYLSLARFWAPSWHHHDPTLLLSYADEMSRQTTYLGPDEIFALCAVGGSDPLTGDLAGIDPQHWPHLRNGLIGLLKRTRGDRQWANWLGRCAVAAGDLATAKAALDRLGDDWLLEVWGSHDTVTRSRALIASRPPAAPPESVPPLAPPVVPRGEEMRFVTGMDFGPAEFTDEVNYLFLQHRFAALDAIAERLRNRSRPRTDVVARIAPGTGSLADGRTLDNFYAALSPPQDAHYVETALAAFADWQAMAPKSTAAMVAAANAWISYGWLARGSGYANSVSSEGWRLLAERVSRADLLLAEAEKLGCRDEAMYTTWFSVGKAQSWPLEQFQHRFEQAVAAERPGSWHAWYAMTQVLLPRWFGSYAALQAYGQRAGAHAGPWKGRAMLPIVAQALSSYPEDWSQVEGRGTFSWPIVRAGLGDLLAQTQGSAHVDGLNIAAHLAWQARDIPYLHKVLKPLGHDLRSGIFGTDWDAFQRWLNLTALPLRFDELGAGYIDAKGRRHPSDVLPISAREITLDVILRHRPATADVVVSDRLDEPPWKDAHGHSHARQGGPPLTLHALYSARAMSRFSLEPGRRQWTTGHYRITELVNGKPLLTHDFYVR